MAEIRSPPLPHSPGVSPGLLASIVLCSNPAIQFVSYERLKRYHAGRRVKITQVEAFVMGAIAKAIATIVTYPYQVVQSRLRMQENQSTSPQACLWDIIENEGVIGLFSGMGTKMIQTVLNSAIMFAIYEPLYAGVSGKFNAMRERDEGGGALLGNIGDSVLDET